MKTFMPHQRKAYRYAKPLARIALFMEMRLGKTLVAIRWAEHNRCKKILIASPKSVMEGWQEELLDEEYAEQDIVLLQGDDHTRTMKACFNHFKWHIINYEGLLYSPQILEVPWDCIILDESTRIRKSRASITKLLNRNTGLVGCKAVLSGHPSPESEMDYYEQFNFLYGSFMHKKNFWFWLQHYCYKSFYNWEVKSCFVAKIKEEVNRLAFCMTRKQAGVGSKKIYQKRYVDMNPKQEKIYKQIKEEFEYEYGKETRTTKWAPVQYEWMSSVASGFTPKGESISTAKLEELLSIIKDCLPGEKIVVWFRHNHEILYARTFLSNRKIKVGMFKGDTKDDKGFKMGDVQVLLAQGKVGMMGLDWSVASTMVYFSNWYDGEIRVQSEDRIIHPKKKDLLLYIDLITRKTIDIDVVEILREKKVVGKYFMMKLNQKFFDNIKKKGRSVYRTSRKK